MLWGKNLYEYKLCLCPGKKKEFLLLFPEGCFGTCAEKHFFGCLFKHKLVNYYEKSNLATISNGSTQYT
jgi:hypothetical protein